MSTEGFTKAELVLKEELDLAQTMGGVTERLQAYGAASLTYRYTGNLPLAKVPPTSTYLPITSPCYLQSPLRLYFCRYWKTLTSARITERLLCRNWEMLAATNTFEMLNKAFPNNAPKRTTVFEWHSRFKAGRISIEDYPRQGRPTFQRTYENVQKITDLIKENPRTTLLELEQDTGISKTTIGRIVTEDLRLKKTPAKFIPRFLTNEQKLCRLVTCEDMLEMTRTDPEWKDKIITGDETWVYCYDPETKRQSAGWRGQGEPRPKKSRILISRNKVLLVVFLDNKGIVHHEYLPAGQTVIKEMYLSILRRLREAIRKKRPEKWTNGDWILHHDNARPHTAHLVTSFLAINGTEILPQPPYSPDIAPNDFFLFPKLKAVLKGRHFDTREDIIEKSLLALKSIPKEAYKNCFDNWEKRWRWREERLCRCIVYRDIVILETSTTPMKPVSSGVFFLTRHFTLREKLAPAERLVRNGSQSFYAAIWMVLKRCNLWSLAGQHRQIILLLDNCGAHPPDMQGLTNTRIAFLPPNTTSMLQPCDQGIIRNFKMIYRTRLMRKYLTAYDAGTALTINLKQAVDIISVAWNDVLPATISNCWHHSGIIKSDVSSPLDTPQPATQMWEQQSLFDRMKEVLKIPLEMDFDSYADADNDVVTNAMLSDIEIVESILQAKEEEETDQVDEEVDPIVHIPHPKEVLESIQTLRLFLQC
ncbi:hypothetical protein LAZ67_8002486 [Cordylochernes scorpioides]|uniref:DDE-1 domain-containing protein n=1 Tax=Cordylochernes scorpioides TaxID=51811 RepID=A0ABY6KSX1_9ARAC|nr:hypothetical protein LAZ67_8002486 [Cordylochernes scorpioides]